MLALLQDVDAVVHMGGVSTEQPWAPILAGNIVGMVNLYEAARQNKVKRVVFASSNHVTGFYRQDQVISPRDPVRPDGYYGLSKAFGENLAQLYWDLHGLETVSLRIGSSFAEPKDRRMLATWMSFDDTERLDRRRADGAHRRPHHPLRHERQQADAFWDNTTRAPHRLPAAGQLRAFFALRWKRASPPSTAPTRRRSTRAAPSFKSGSLRLTDILSPTVQTPCAESRRDIPRRRFP